jgi:lipopolysaccharide export system protein LptA
VSVRRARLRTAALLLGAGLVLGPAAWAETSIGVAPFERVAAEGHGVPDVAGRLAQRLGTRGVDKVVGPEELGAPALAEPPAHEVAGFAGKAGVARVVVGRTTRLGNALSVDARVLDARTGEPLGPRIVEEAARPEDLGRAVEALADAVLEQVGDPPVSPAVAAAPPSAAAPAPAKPRGGPDGPISIKADALEVLDGPQKTFHFNGNVRAVQDDLVLISDKLEAEYPRGGTQPERLVATGRVRIEQEGRTARCQRAVYYRAERRMVCTGDARVDQKCDRVSGREITFYLDRDVLKVDGAADVQLLQGAACSAPTARSEP